MSISHPDRGYDMFVTSAVSDGAKMCDVRSNKDECVLGILLVKIQGVPLLKMDL